MIDSSNVDFGELMAHLDDKYGITIDCTTYDKGQYRWYRGSGSYGNFNCPEAAAKHAAMNVGLNLEEFQK